MVQARAILTTGRPIESRIMSIELSHFQWPWTTYNPDFKATPLFDAEYIRNGTRYKHSYDRMGTHTLLKGIISNDLKWFSDRFNMTRSIARSLRQLSFLLESSRCADLKSYLT